MLLGRDLLAVVEVTMTLPESSGVSRTMAASLSKAVIIASPI